VISKVEVFSVVKSCSVVVRYKRFRGAYCLNLQVKVLLVVTPCNVAVGYQRFKLSRCLHKDGSLTAMMFQVEVFRVVTSCCGPQLEIYVLYNELAVYKGSTENDMLNQ
jgi:hypothetical protein